MGEGGSSPGHLPPATGTVERHVLGGSDGLVHTWALTGFLGDVLGVGLHCLGHHRIRIFFKVSGVVGERLQSQAFSVKLCAEKGILALPQTQPLTCKELAAGQGAFCCPDALKK